MACGLVLSGVKYAVMRRKKAAIGMASATSLPGAIYGAGDPSSQTQRKETRANVGRMKTILMILHDRPSAE